MLIDKQFFILITHFKYRVLQDAISYISRRKVVLVLWNLGVAVFVEDENDRATSFRE